MIGDEINLPMAATAWNLKKWLIAFFWCLFYPAISLGIPWKECLGEDG